LGVVAGTCFFVHALPWSSFPLEGQHVPTTIAIAAGWPSSWSTTTMVLAFVDVETLPWVVSMVLGSDAPAGAVLWLATQGPLPSHALVGWSSAQQVKIGLGWHAHQLICSDH
jgi:hypothetical protein